MIIIIIPESAPKGKGLFLDPTMAFLSFLAVFEKLKVKALC